MLAAVTGDGYESGRAGSAASHAQRERLIDSFTRIASERGYERTTVEGVTAAAGLPEGAFYEHFTDKRQCLSAAYDAFVDRMVDEAQQATEETDDWPSQVKEAVAAGLSFVSETAARARFFAVEAPAAGPVMFERYVAATDRIVFLLRSGRERYPHTADLPDFMEEVLVGGAATLVSGALLSEEHTRLPSLEPELVEIILTPYLGREEARRFAS
jgi:AcrR family transcriptional regulator